MLEILFSWLSIPRTIGIWIDSIAFSLVDNIYDLIYAFASATFFEESMILTIMNNTYIAISIFALFRIALILVNAMINPDKLSDKENGIGSVLRNLVVMFVLLIFTPLLFREANYIQSKVVEGNYIQKIFLPDNAQSEDPGTEMKKIAMGALIHPDDAFATYDSTTGLYTPKDTCTGKCETAVSDYNTMIQSDAKGMFSVFTKHIGRTEKVDEDGDGEKETVYVYTYMFVVTLIVGCFITYILFTFGLDIAIRAVELAVLQMIAPLFIVTYIDPKSAKTGPFHNWLKTVGKTYASLFIKLAILSLMIMFISLIDQIKVSDNVGLIGKLVILLAILIFAKKAPKWIGDMIGVDGETSGLGGLGKKIGSAALVGGALTKTARGLAGGAAGVANNALRNARHNRKLKKDAGLDRKGRNKAKKEYKEANNNSAKGFRSQWSDDKRAARKANGLTAKDKALRNVAGSIGGVAQGFSTGMKADKLTGAFKGGITASNQFSDKAGLQGKSLLNRAGGFVKDKYGRIIDAGYGTPSERADAADRLDKQRKREQWFTSSGLAELGGADNENLVGGMGGYSKATKDKNGVRALTEDDAWAMIRARACGIKVEDIEYDKDNKLHIKGISDIGQYATEARNMATDAGIAHMSEMFNKSQSNVVNEYRSNQDAINSGIQNLNSTNETVSKLLSGFGSGRDGVSTDPRTGAMQITGVDGGGIVIDPRNLKSSLDGLEMKTSQDYMQARAEHEAGRMSDSDFMVVTERATNVQNFINDAKKDDSIVRQMEAQAQMLGSLDAIMERQKVLAPTYSFVGAEKDDDGKYTNSCSTTEQKLEYISLSADKISKKITAIESKNNDEKK